MDKIIIQQLQDQIKLADKKIETLLKLANYLSAIELIQAKYTILRKN